MSTWYDELEDRIGIRVFEPKAHRWEAILKAKECDGGLEAFTDHQLSVPGRAAEELRDCVIWLSKQRVQVPERFTVERLFSWLRWYRKERAGERHGFTQDTPQGFINFVKSKMVSATRYIDRWNILCSPEIYANASRTTTKEECDELNKWAETRWRDWHMATAEELEIAF